MKDKILKVLDTVSVVWSKLPKEVKVSIYIAVSYGIADLITRLEAVDQSGFSMFLVFGINIVLVFLRELGNRIKAAREFIANRTSK